MLREFRDFLAKGNILTAAIAFVLGVTFAPVVSTVVDRLVMPLVGMLVGQPNFDTVGTFACVAPGSAEAAADGLINGCAGSVGAVLTVIVNFLLVGLVLFMILKLYNRTQKPEEPKADPGPSEIDLLTEIRDSLAR